MNLAEVWLYPSHKVPEANRAFREVARTVTLAGWVGDELIRLSQRTLYWSVHLGVVYASYGNGLRRT